MKTLTKIFSTLAIIMAMIFTGMQSADAQMKVKVQWATQCPDTCTSHGICSYYVEYSIFEICGGDPEEVCPTAGTFVDCSEYSADFVCDYDCEGATHDPCFFVVARVTKFCTGPLGTIAICTGDGQKLKPCADFINPGVTVPITWN